MSRDKILSAIAKAKPAAVPMPAAFVPTDSIDNLVVRYLETLRSIGGTGRVVKSLDDVEAYVNVKLASETVIVNCLGESPQYNADAFIEKDAAAVEAVHTVFLRGAVAVAENAAVWVPERAMLNRLLPFICQELVVLIEKNDIVPTMHEAYQRVQVDEDGFGTFIAGPSKTADIEQSLVIGAHGPLSLQVFLLDDGGRL